MSAEKRPGADEERLTKISVAVGFSRRLEIIYFEGKELLCDPSISLLEFSRWC